MKLRGMTQLIGCAPFDILPPLDKKPPNRERYSVTLAHTQPKFLLGRRDRKLVCFLRCPVTSSNDASA